MPHHHTAERSAKAGRHINLRLERWHRRAVYGSCAALVASGVVWLLGHYFFRSEGQFGQSVSPLEPWAMRVHGAAMMAVLFFLGSLLNSHIRRAIKAGRNLASGWSMIAAMLFLTVTGFGLYYLAGESDRPLWSAAHWIVGLGLGLLIAPHVWLGRRARPRGA